MSEDRYTLFHRPGGNWLDWFETLEGAVEARKRWVTADPRAVPEIEIWDDEQGVQIELDLKTGQPATAA